MTSRWEGRSLFAEVAEALSLSTEHVMAYLPHDAGHELVGGCVLYTQPDDPDVAYLAHLRRDGDGVLFRATEPRVMPGVIEEIKRRLEALADPAEEETSE